MQKKSWWSVLGLFIGLLFLPYVASTPVGHAQEGGNCAAQVEQAVAAAASTCAGLPTGAVCAGNDAVMAFQVPLSPVDLSPTLPLQGLSQIRTDLMDLANPQAPGIALLRVPGMGATEQLSAVLFGSAVLANEPGAPIPPVCRATSIGTVNVRAEPNTDSIILGQLLVNESAPVSARLQDSSWWQIVWNGQPAWVFAELTPADCDPAAMVVIDPATGELSGGQAAPDFQSVRLDTGFLPAECPEAPRGGLLLQSEGESASWRVNGVSLGLDGTVLLQAGPDDVLAVQVLEGQVVLEVGGVSRAARAGQLLRVPLRGGEVESVPGLPLDYLSTDVALAPVSLLPRPIELPQAAAASVPLPEGADLDCDVLPQGFAFSSDSMPGTAQVRVVADAGQPMRVSVSSPQQVNRLLVQPPDQAEAQIIAEAVVSDQIALTSLVGSTVTEAAGIYTFSAETGAPGASVTFTVTCDLPPALEPPPLQACEALLLDWTDVSGGTVRFTGRQAATISVVAEHALPSQGPAQTLQVLTEAGEPIGSVAFVAFPDRQVAGPLDVALPQDGTYLIRWDGDPFNVVQVEALCRLPPTITPTPAPPA